MENIEYLNYLPHGKEILAIREIKETTQSSIVCTAEGEGSVFDLIEFSAQAAAVGRIAASTSNAPRFGAIIRIKEFSSRFSVLPKNLTLHCDWSESVGNVYEVCGEISDGEEMFAKVQMTMMEFE